VTHVTCKLNQCLRAQKHTQATVALIQSTTCQGSTLSAKVGTSGAPFKRANAGCEAII
jgi:hypothetical protein